MFIDIYVFVTSDVMLSNYKKVYENWMMKIKTIHKYGIHNYCISCYFIIVNREKLNTTKVMRKQKVKLAKRYADYFIPALRKF